MTTTQEETAQPRLVPLNAIFAEDFVQILVAVTTANTIAEVAEAVAHHTEGKRVPRRDADRVVFHNGRRLRPDLTVAEAGINPLDHVRVEYDI